MQSFGKRRQAIEFDPWAARKQAKPRETVARERSFPTSRIAGYLVALITVGVLAVAGFEILLHA